MHVMPAIAETSSARAAAEAVALTPSAVGKPVGRELLTRSHAGLAPDAQGVAIAGFARRFVSLARGMGGGFDRELATGRVRLVMTDEVGLARMPELVWRRTFVHPGLRIALAMASRSELLESLAALAIVSDGGGARPLRELADDEVARRRRPERNRARGGSAGPPHARGA